MLEFARSMQNFIVKLKLRSSTQENLVFKMNFCKVSSRANFFCVQSSSNVVSPQIFERSLQTRASSMPKNSDFIFIFLNLLFTRECRCPRHEKATLRVSASVPAWFAPLARNNHACLVHTRQWSVDPNTDLYSIIDYQYASNHLDYSYVVMSILDDEYMYTSTTFIYLIFFCLLYIFGTEISISI